MKESLDIKSILPERPLEDAPVFLSESERHQLLVEWNRTAADYPQDKTIHELFEAQVERTPEAVALVFEGEKLTYRELNERANQLAHHLRKLGIGPEKLVGLFVERSLELVVGLLGILKAGGAYLPMDPQYPKERLAFMLADSQSSVIVTQNAFSGNFEATDAKLVCLDLDWPAISIYPTTNLKNHTQPHQLAYVIYTSGSTGAPKGALISHYNVVRLFQATQDWFHFAQTDVWTLFHSCAFDFSVWELWGALFYGGRLVVVSFNVSRSPDSFYRLLNEEGVTVLNQTPAAFRQLIRVDEQIDQEALDSGLALRLVIFGGEALDFQSLKPWFDRHGDQCPQLVNMYGITETTVHVTYRTICAADLSGGSVIGRPIPDLQIYLLDEQRQPVPIGVPGEIYVGGAGLARGYLNRPELTAEKFIQHPFSDQPGARLYKTGDLCRYLPDGNIEYLGRIDQQVKIRGFRIELGEIEAVLGGHPAVRENVVVAREDVPGEKTLAAYLVVREGTAPTVTELREHLLKQLPDYMVPAAFVELAKLPLTPNGKIDRKALPAPEANRLGSGLVYVAPRTPAEAALAAIWGELLGLKQVGIHENFFALGGHSLLAVRMIFRIQDTLKVDLPVKQILECPTMAELGRAVEAAGKAGVNRAPHRPMRLPRPGSGQPAKFPVSFNQQQLWFIDQLEPGRSVYNIPLAIRLKGRLNREALQQSLNQLIQRHEVLRTTFPTEQGEPVQVVAPELTLELPVVELEKLSETEREEEIGRHQLQAAGWLFDLSRGPLLRAELLCLERESQVLLLMVHHIVFDGWSVDVLLRELAAGYAAYAAGREPELAALPMQYADYAAWQREYLTPERLEEHLCYWRKQLAGVPTVLGFPTDKPRPLVADHRGAHRVLALPQELAAALAELGRQQGTTLFVVLLASFQSLLHRYSGQQSLLVGSPISGRTLKESEDLIGFFVNALPLKADFSGNPQFTELLGQIHKTVWEAQTHQKLPFEKLVAELQPERDLSRNPIFQVSFIFENEPPVMQMGLLKWESEFVRTSTVKFDLAMTFIEKNGGLRGVLEYATGLFEPETICRLAEHYLNLLADIVTDPQQRVSDLRLLSDSEQNQILIEWNKTAADYPRDKTIHQLFEAQAGKTPNAVAVVCDGKELTYCELDKQANQLAHRLRAFGIGPDGLVGIYIERSLELVVGLLGILKAGGAYVPLDVKNPRSRLLQQLKDVKTLLTRTELLPQLPEFAGTVVCFDRDRQELARMPQNNLEPVETPENLAYVIFTSGSTGAPKGVAVRHRNIVNYSHFIGRRLGLKAFPDGLKFALVSTVAADLGNTCIFPALLSGGCLHVMNDEMVMNPDSFARYVSQHKIDVLKITPSHFAALLTVENPQSALPRRFLIFGGEVLSPQLVRRIQNLAGTCQIINHYGPTETTVGSLTLTEDDFGLDQLPVNASVPIGRPIANTQAYILDEQLQPMPVGLSGQLYIGGDGVASGYYKNPKSTAEKFIPNPFCPDPDSRLYSTGDLARYLPNGRIEFLGRTDYQVKIRGFRIELREVEAAIKDHPEINQCVLAVQTHEPDDHQLVAYVVPTDPQSPLTIDAWRNFLRSKLPDYMIPAAFVNLEKLPLTPNGKIDRKALQALDLPPARQGLLKQTDLPQNSFEMQMLLIWQRVLNLKIVGIRDNFFDLGGHSLLAVRLVNEINKSLNLSLSIPVFFQNPTIEGIIHTLETEDHRKPEPKLISLQPGRSGRALFFLDASMGQCQLAQLLDVGIASFATIVPLPASALQAAALNDENNLPSLEELAATHAMLIQKHQPSDVCLLVGHSFGGVLAFEVAHQLQRQGRTVEMILLLDSWVMDPPWWRKLKMLSLARAWNSLQFRISHWWLQKRNSAAGVPQSTEAALEVANQPIGNVPWEIFQRIYRQARKKYRFRPLDSRAIVFCAQHSEMAHFYAVSNKLGWAGLLTCGIEVVETPGNHFTLLKEPNLRVLAGHFKERLKQP